MASFENFVLMATSSNSGGHHTPLHIYGLPDCPDPSHGATPCLPEKRCIGRTAPAIEQM
jgi:hypothetical protein